MNAHGRPLVAIDPQALIFAVGLESKSIRLYDFRNFDRVCHRFNRQGGVYSKVRTLGALPYIYNYGS